jgi:hypothetical protein
MPNRLPGDFPPRFLELPPVFLDAYLTARAVAGVGLNRAVNAEKRETLFREAPKQTHCLCGPLAKLRVSRGDRTDI